MQISHGAQKSHLGGARGQKPARKAQEVQLRDLRAGLPVPGKRQPPSKGTRLPLYDFKCY